MTKGFLLCRFPLLLPFILPTYPKKMKLIWKTLPFFTLAKFNVFSNDFIIWPPNDGTKYVCDDRMTLHYWRQGSSVIIRNLFHRLNIHCGPTNKPSEKYACNCFVWHAKKTNPSAQVENSGKKVQTSKNSKDTHTHTSRSNETSARTFYLVSVIGQWARSLALQWGNSISVFSPHLRNNQFWFRANSIILIMQ